MVTKEGWGLPEGCRKAHYFVEGMSLCGRHGYYFGSLKQGDDESPGNCVLCKKKLRGRGIE